MQQNKALWYLFNSITREISSTNIALRHLLLETIDEKLDEEKILFNYFDRSWIWNFGNA